MGWVLDHSPAKGTDRLVLLSIANHAGKSPVDGAWEAWPGIETIQREAALDRQRTVNDALARLTSNEDVERVVNGAPDERIRKDRRPNLYRILLKNGVTCGDTRCSWCGVTSDVERGDVSRPDGVTFRDGTGCRPASGEPSLNLTDEPEKQPRETSTKIVDVDLDPIDQLCDMLADQIERHRSGVRPKRTKRWHRDMRLLVERGPLHVEGAQPVPIEKVLATIKVVFTHLAVPDPKSGFCWADQVRSPAALRDHWVQMAEAYRRQSRTTVGRGAQAIDRVASRLLGHDDAPEPLGLLEGGKT